MAFLQSENSVPAENGTDHAILYESGGRQPHALNSWGGARNSRLRRSDTIKPHAALAFVEAAQRAVELGLPYNRFITIHWERAGIPDTQAAGATGSFVKRLNDWVRKRGGQTACGWVRENGEGKGSHVHILAHVPKGYLLGSLTQRWVKAAGGKLKRGIVRTEPIGGSSGSAFGWQDWYLPNLADVTNYVLKGVDRATGEALDLDRYEQGGRITGKRISISQNLRG